MEDKYADRYGKSESTEQADSRTFWFSLLSAVSVLAIVGLFLYAAQLNNQTPGGVQPGVGGGPGFPSFSPDIAPIPSSTAPTFP